MARARTKRGRLRQVEHWLQARFPPPRTTRVQVCRIADGSYGDITRHGSDLVIRIDYRLKLGLAFYFLFEEWAHAMTWTLAKLEDAPHHSPEWGLAYAQLRTEFMDNGGCEESYDYPED